MKPVFETNGDASVERCQSCRTCMCVTEPASWEMTRHPRLASEFHMSWMAFQVPSGCFFQAVTYFPFSLTDLPSGCRPAGEGANGGFGLSGHPGAACGKVR